MLEHNIQEDTMIWVQALVFLGSSAVLVAGAGWDIRLPQRGSTYSVTPEFFFDSLLCKILPSGATSAYNELSVSAGRTDG